MNHFPAPDFRDTTVWLPMGLWIEGKRACEASIRTPSGADEEVIGDAGRWPSPAAHVTALLAATVTRIGPLAPIGVEHVRALSVLDRDVLLMALRRLLFGDSIQSTIRCPNPACHKRVDIDFLLSDVPIPAPPDVAPRYRFAIGNCEITYRLPNGGDQETVAVLAKSDASQAAQMILQHCVDPFEELTAEEIAALRDEMACRDPQLETEFDAKCLECGTAFAAHFDIQDFLLQELSDMRLQLYRQVHTLAWYYHWSEAEILAMPFHKRRIYLKFLSEMLGSAEEVRA